MVVHDNPGDAHAERWGGDPPAVTLTGQVQQVRRYWWVVAVVVGLAMAGALVSALFASVTYTSRASLILSTNNRSPDQDAVLVQGYVDYFNDAAYQSQLLGDTGITSAVTLSARAAASSPIMLIEATASSPQSAEEAALQVAEAFRQDINAQRESQIKDAQARLKAQISALDAKDSQDAVVIASLRDQIASLEAERDDLLQELQYRGGTAENAPSVVTNTVFALVGGLLIGIIAALGVARVASISERDPSGPSR